MEFKDYYKVLGVDKGASLKEIKKAYRKLALKLHPDVQEGGDSDEGFKELVEAYEVLKNSERRAEYDELLKYGNTRSNEFQPPPGWQGANAYSSARGESDFSDFFNSVFGSGFDPRQSTGHTEQFGYKGQDAEIEVPIFLEDTISNESKTIQFSYPTLENGQIKQARKTLKVNIPLGGRDGERIRLKGQGGKGTNHGPNGDLYLHIRLVPHPIFDVEAHNLILTVPITPWEAVLGAKINVPTLTGKITLTIKPNSQTGQKLRITGKGLKTRDGAGDMIAVLKIVMPSTSTDSDRKLWQQLAESNHQDVRAEWSNHNA